MGQTRLNRFEYTATDKQACGILHCLIFVSVLLRRLLRSGSVAVLAPLLATNMIFLDGATAAEVPNFDQPVDFNVREQNINEFLNALFQEIDVPVSINTELEGNVNGKFQDTARNVFDEISNAFSLTVYYDGAVAQTYRKNEIRRKILQVDRSESKRVLSIAQSMQLPDLQNTIQIEDTGVLVSGTERFIAQIDEIITSVKQTIVKPKARKPPVTEVELISFPEESPIVYRVFKLKHAWAVDTTFPVGGQTIVIPGVATLLKELLQGDTASVSFASENSDLLQGLRGEGLNKGAYGSGDETGEEKQDELLTIPRIVADSRLNAIVIRDKEEKMNGYERLIDSLDVESGMVEIEATIIDINTDKSRELGINWRYQDDDVDVLLGGGAASDQALVPGSGPITTQGRGGILSFSLGEPANFLARVRALEEQGAAKVISKPHVITLSDVEAVLAATTEFFVRVAGDEEVDLFNVPVGTTLRVTPHIFADENRYKIKLLVNIEDGSQSAGASVDNIPVIERASISTQAVVSEGDSLLVGGLVREAYRDTGYSVPVLGRVPLVGGLFRTERKQVTRVERLFMITPRLAAGIGFDGSPYSSALAGQHSTIVNDAADRISSQDYIHRPAINYESMKSRREAAQKAAIAAKEKSVASSKPLTKPVISELPESRPESSDLESSDQESSDQAVYATIENNVFLSPFTVEQWSGED